MFPPPRAWRSLPAWPFCTSQSYCSDRTDFMASRTKAIFTERSTDSTTTRPRMAVACWLPSPDLSSFCSVGRHFVEIQQSPWGSLPEFTNKNDSIFRNSSPARARSMASIIEVILFAPSIRYIVFIKHNSNYLY